MDQVASIVLIVLGALVLAAVLSIFLAFPIMWCWNYAVVSTFGLPMITWGKAWCLSFLAGCLIKSTSINTKS